MPVLFRWDTLRLHLDSPQNSFEALCAALAERDTRFVQPSDRFVRLGRPDGGVECLWERPDGSMHGYQAKFHRTAFGDSQLKQLDKSVKKALASYPQMKSLTVCLPFDLPHSPRKATKTARERWESWKKSWEQRAKRTKRKHFTIDLWDESSFVKQLAEPSNSGVLQFFFGAPILQPAQVAAHVKQQVAWVGPRYQPHVHVEHELEPLFDWLASSETFRQGLNARVEEIRVLLQCSDVIAIRPSGVTVAKAFAREHELLDRIAEGVRAWPPRPIAAACVDLVGTLQENVLEEAYGRNPDRSPKTKTLPQSDQHRLYKAWRRLEAITDKLDKLLDCSIRAASPRWIDAHDSRFVVIEGGGGCGKTHLLCRVAQQAADQKHPVVLLLGQSLSASRLRTELHPPGNKSLEQLLESLDFAGAIAGCRGLLLIDAINEAEDVSKWKAELRAIAALLERYPHVAIVVTVRDSYATQLLPSCTDTPSLVHIEHYGFSGTTREALRIYCDYYHINVPDVPVFNPELDNPLFLSMLCIATAGTPDPKHQRPAKTFPGGHIGFRTVFEKFLDAKEQALDERFELDRDSSSTPLRTTVEALAGAMAASPSLELAAPAASDIVRHHLKGARLAGNLLSLLESEGLLLKVPRYADGDSDDFVEQIRFAYDRMHAHFIVSTWLAPHKSPDAALDVVKPGGTLDMFVTSDQTGMGQSLCDEVVLQWPGRYGVELFDTAPKLAESAEWCRRVFRTMRVASPNDWTTNTGRWLMHSLSKVNDGCIAHVQYVLGLLQRVGHTQLVSELHGYLNGMPLAARDAWWTTAIADNYARHELELVRWPQEQNVLRLEVPQALSYATALAWLTTVTVRSLRASATRAMSAVVGCALDAGGDLLQRFQKVNDPYVLQAVAHAVYGACLRSSDDRLVRKIAERVLQLWAKPADWPVDLLCRHSLAGIVECAQMRCPDWTVDLRRVIPPYASEWVGEVLPWKEIDARAKAEFERKRFGLHQIVSSCIPEGQRNDASGGMYGDFGRYVVDSALSRFFRRDESHDQSFEHDLAHRFIVTRVLQMGWTPELFDEFDKRHSWSGDRHKSPIERIGKKYQWIGLHEFLARAADRYPLYDWNGDEYRYQNPIDVSQYFTVDTSLVRVPRPAGKSPSIEDIDSKMAPESLWIEPDDNRWTLSSQGWGDPAECLVQKVPTGDAVLLHGYFDWKERKDSATNDPDAPYRDVSLSVVAYAIKTSDVPKLDKWMRSTRAQGRPDPVAYSSVAFGELYWSRPARAISVEAEVAPDEPWQKPRHANECPIPLISLAASYDNESDNGIGESIYAPTPSHWLADRLHARAGPREFEFTNQSGRPMCWTRFDAKNGVVQAGYALQAPVVDVLEREELSLVWWVTGIKTVIDRAEYSDKGPIRPFLQGLYVWRNGQLSGWSGISFDEQFRRRKKRTYPQPFVLTQVWATPRPKAKRRKRGQRARR